MLTRRGKSDRRLLVAVLAVSAVIVVGLAAYVKLGPADRVVPTELVEEQLGGAGVVVLVPYFFENDLKFRTEEAEVPADTDPRVFAINQFLRNVNAVPVEASAIGCTVVDGIARLDFNEAFDRTYGTEDEMIVVNGILSAMSQFEEVFSVRFLTRGQPMETLGNLDLSDPMPVLQPNLIGSGAGAQTTASS